MAGAAVSTQQTAKATSGGAIKFTWPNVPQGRTWRVSVVVPTAPNTAAASVYLTGTKLFPLLGSQPSAAFEVSQGRQLTVIGTGFTKTTQFTAFAIGSIYTGAALGIPPTGPSTLTQVTQITEVVNLPAPPQTTGKILTIRTTLKGTSTKRHLWGTTTPTPATRFTTLKIGVLVRGTPTNAGKLIYIGFGNITTSSFAITAKHGVHWFGYKQAANVYLLGTTGDIANVWAE